MFFSRRNFLKTSLGIATTSLFYPDSFNKNENSAFIDKLLPAPKHGGFYMDDYWIWDPSVVKDEKGKYHMFASRWSKKYGFENWVTNSEIVRAISDVPEGPYVFQEVVLSARGNSFFDGRATHNPRIVKSQDYYVLYYFGTTYTHESPRYGESVEHIWHDAWMNKRIGIAYSRSLEGPWVRASQPVINPRRGEWDSSITSNPSPVVLPDGRVYLVYKSSKHNSQPPLLLGAAIADDFKGPYSRLSNEPIFSFHSDNNQDNDVEDPFVWWNGHRFELIMKDRFGHICGEEGGGVHAISSDGIHWTLSNPVKAYSRKILWDDGDTTLQANFERPFLLFEGDKPTHLFAATGSGSSAYTFDKTWNMVIPLKTE